MADDLTTILRFVGDPANAEAAINGLISSLQNAAKQSANIFSGLNASSETAAAKIKPLTTEVEALAKAEKDGEAVALAYARAQAQLEKTQGGLAAAQNTLRQALAGVSGESIAAIRTQSQLASVQNQIIASTQRAENAMVREAVAAANLRQNLGDVPGALKILSDAQAKLSNTQGINATRLALRKTYLETNYENSPLISAINRINSGLSGLSPVLGSTGGQLQGLLGNLTSVVNFLPGTGAAGGEAAAGLGEASTAASGLTVALGGTVAVVGAVVVGLGALVAVGAASAKVLIDIGQAGLRANADLE